MRRESLSDRYSRIFHRLCRAAQSARVAWEPEGYPSRGWTWEEATAANIRADRLRRLHAALGVRIEREST